MGLSAAQVFGNRRHPCLRWHVDSVSAVRGGGCRHAQEDLRNGAVGDQHGIESQHPQLQWRLCNVASYIEIDTT